MGRRGVAAVAAAVMAAAAGCGSSSVADPSSPVPITSTSQPSSSSPTASTTSASASQTVDPDSDAAIIAAVHAYAAAFQTAARTAKVAEFDALTTQTCNCRQGVQKVASQLQAMRATTDVKLGVDNIHVIARAKDRARVSFKVSNAAYRVINAQDQVVARAAAATSMNTVDFQLVGETWIAYLSE